MFCRRCWAETPNDRPSTSVLKRKLDTLCEVQWLFFETPILPPSQNEPVTHMGASSKGLKGASQGAIPNRNERGFPKWVQVLMKGVNPHGGSNERGNPK